MIREELSRLCTLGERHRRLFARLLLPFGLCMTNPLTPLGKTVDVGLEAWAIFVVTAVAGSFSTFFGSGDTS